MAFSQNDPLWAGLTLGFGPSTIGQAGCFLTSFANLLTDAGYPVVPAALNERMKAMGAFSDDLIIDHQVPNQIAPQLLDWLGEVHWDEPPQPTPMDFFADAADPSIRYIVCIDASPAPGVQTHFVYVVGTTGADLVIDDPWDGRRKMLSEYGVPSELIQAAYKWRIKVKGGNAMPNDGDIDNVFLDINNRKATEVEKAAYRNLPAFDPNGIYYNKVEVDLRNIRQDDATRAGVIANLTDENTKLVTRNEVLQSQLNAALAKPAVFDPNTPSGKGFRTFYQGVVAWVTTPTVVGAVAAFLGNPQVLSYISDHLSLLLPLVGGVNGIAGFVSWLQNKYGK